VIFEMGRKTIPFYGDGHYSKGKTIHRKKSRANAVAKSCRITGIAYKIVKLKGGWRVDKRY